MKNLTFLLMGLALVMSCGQDPLAEGDAAYQRGDYARAVKFYQEAQQKNPRAVQVKEKLALAYCRLGQMYYQKRRVWRAFEANVEKGVGLLPEQPSPETLQELSRVYLALARAFKETPPENLHQKQRFFEKTLRYLEKARELDPNNGEVEQALNDFMNANFEEMLQKGQRYFELGTQDPANYLVAEYYLSHALKFRPQDARAADYLKRCRQEALVVPDMDLTVPLAITNHAHKKGLDAFYVVAINNTAEPVSIHPAGFALALADGQVLQPLLDHPFAHPFPESSVAPGKSAEGVVVFRIPGRASATRLEYRSNGDVLGYKNLP